MICTVFVACVGKYRLPHTLLFLIKVNPGARCCKCLTVSNGAQLTHAKSPHGFGPDLDDQLPSLTNQLMTEIPNASDRIPQL